MTAMKVIVENPEYPPRRLTIHELKPGVLYKDDDTNGIVAVFTDTYLKYSQLAVVFITGTKAGTAFSTQNINEHSRFSVFDGKLILSNDT